MMYHILAVQRSFWGTRYDENKSSYKLQYKRFGIWWTITTFDTRNQAEEALELLDISLKDIDEKETKKDI